MNDSNEFDYLENPNEWLQKIIDEGKEEIILVSKSIEGITISVCGRLLFIKAPLVFHPENSKVVH
tara:strand:+ start:593 stop:787 length:195 start_codon:yes stop_codon:yes gene_type:complete